MLTTKIQGQVFEVSAPYNEGHSVTAKEAEVLNRVRAENIGNNMRGQVNEALGEADSDTLDEKQHKAMQDAVTEYDNIYSFSMTRTRAATNPLDAERKRIAVKAIKDQCAAQNMTVKEYKEKIGSIEKYNAKVQEVMDMPRVIEIAKQNIDVTNNILG